MTVATLYDATTWEGIKLRAVIDAAVRLTDGTDCPSRAARERFNWGALNKAMKAAQRPEPQMWIATRLPGAPLVPRPGAAAVLRELPNLTASKWIEVRAKAAAITSAWKTLTRPQEAAGVDDSGDEPRLAAPTLELAASMLDAASALDPAVRENLFRLDAALHEIWVGAACLDATGNIKFRTVSE